MKLKKYFVTLTIVLTSLISIFAQDDFASFDDDEFESSFGSFDSFSDDSSSIASAFSFSGDLSLDVRYYFSKDDSSRFLQSQTDVTSIPIGEDDQNGDKIYFTDAKLIGVPKAKLGVDYSGETAEANLILNFSEDIIKNHPEDVIDELILRGYFLQNHLTLEAGKMKVVWGKGDKLHVIDNFNADDYTDFIIPDYIDRRISTPMLRAVYSLDEGNIRIEGIFTPFMPTDRFATEGMWIPQSYATLMTTLMQVASVRYGASAGNFDKMYSDLVDAKDALLPDTNKLDYSQAGLHITGTVGMFDWGLSYYYGRNKQPSANAEELLTWKALASKGIIKSQIPYISLDYDKKQTLGLEAATVAGRFNLRGEFAYNITEDKDGKDPWVHNNSIAWLFGIDFDLPISNLNLNIQETGTYILNKNEIEDSAFKTFDVDYNSKDIYTNDRLVVNISDSWFNEKVKPEVTFLWGIERSDFIVQPKITYSPSAGLSLMASAMIVNCKDEDSEFYYWQNNDFINFTVRYQF